MNDRNLLRGLFLLAFALTFGITASHYAIGSFGRAGPGLFPLVIAGMLGVVGLITVIRSRFVAKDPMDLNFRNIGVILAALCLFALVSHFVKMIAGIAAMVFVAGFAGKAAYSVKRNLLITLGLVAIALMFQQFLGFNLPLY